MTETKMPKNKGIIGAAEHVAIIMDGNGRWAKSRGKPRLYGHRAGAKRVRDIVEACPQLGVKYLTLCLFHRKLETYSNRSCRFDETI